MTSPLRTVILGGGTGFIGSALKKTLEELGYTVVVISRKSFTLDALKVEGLPKSIYAVVNLAGQNILDPTRRWTAGFKQNVYASRVHTTRYLAEIIQDASVKPKVFVTMSGVGFYQPSAFKEYTEDSTGGNFDFFSHLCSEWENASEVTPSGSVRTVNIRSGVVLGRHGGMIKQLFLPFYMGLGGPVGSGKQLMPWIHIDDIVGLFVHAIENENVSGAMNGVAPDIVTNKEFSTAFGKALWRPSKIPLPIFIVNMLFSPERAKIMTEGQNVVPKKAINTGYDFIYPDINSAAKQFSKLF